jgi:multidrug efflux pump
MRIAELSIRRPVLATVLSALLVIVGLVSLSRLAVRELPDIDPPVVSVQASYRGASAQIVENKVTQVIEDRIAGVEGIDKLKSQSRDERASINIEFSLDRNVEEAVNDIRDRISRVVGDLPTEVDPPEVAKSEANSEPVLFVNFSSDKVSTLDLTDFAERYVTDRLAAAPGVAVVEVFGGRRYAMRIWLDRTALAARGLTVNEVEAALRRENVQVPAGRLESTQREFTLRADTGYQTEADFRQLVVGRGADGYLVRLGDVADVRLAAESDRSLSRSNGEPGVTLAVQQQSKANTIDVVDGVGAQIEAVNADLPQGMGLDVNLDRSVFIRASLREVVYAVVFALVGVLLVIYLFLGQWRATLIPALTIPISIIAAFTVMYAFGFSINVLTLLGIVLAIGLVVDDAIVVLENIFRRREAGQPMLLAAIDGSREIGFAVVATTATLTAVFLPISFLPGNVGRLFREFGFTIAAAILFSALVALTLTPMMASRLPEDAAHSGRVARAVNAFFLRVSARYRAVLERLVHAPWRVIGATGVMLVLAVLAYRTLPSEFSPQDDRGLAWITLTAPEGASLGYTDGYTRQVEAILADEARKYGDIKRYIVRLPGGFGGGQGEVNTARISLLLEDFGHPGRRPVKAVLASAMKRLEALPGVRASGFAAGAFSGRGGGQPLQAVIGGPDYMQIAQWTAKLQDRAEASGLFVNVDTDYKERKPQLRVTVDRDRAADLGVSLQAVGRTLETMLGSRIVTTYVDRGREYNVILQGRADERATPTDLANLYVRSDRGGALIPLSNLVRLEETSGAATLNRFDRMRSITVSAALAPGTSLGEGVKWFQEAVRTELPATARLSFDGESREYLKSGSQLVWIFLMAIAVVFLVLAAQFESFRHPLIIMSTVPLALLGAVLGLKAYQWAGADGASINIFSQIAVIMLVGIAAKNGVLIVEFANQLRDRGTEFIEAVIEASVTRLRPVLMTSLCTAVGALPFLFATGAGAEQRKPIGIVVFYGTTISVLLTLFVVPAVYALVARNTRSPEYMTQLIARLRGAAAPGSAGSATADLKAGD